MNIKANIWIGLVQISNRPDNGLLDGAKGAYVNVLAMANDSFDFIEKVKKALANLELGFVQIEDVEPFSERSKYYEMDENIINLAIEVSKTKELCFGNFHTFNE
jgi:hypothetical protein